jgi:hypothetical protein
MQAYMGMQVRQEANNMGLAKDRKMQVEVTATEGHGRGLTIVLGFDSPTDRDWVLQRLRDNFRRGGDETIRNATLIVE